jgi:quercetin dioxygenase-like cupin family protein
MNELTRQLNGLPILLNRPTLVVAMYLEPHGSMHEHPANEPILILAMRGNGFVRIGGPEGETRSVTAGEAVLWPGGLDHKVWTEDEPLEFILIHGPAEREEAS